MKFIVGLGNPGEEYVDTRHNIGFIVLDEIRNKYYIAASHFKKNKPLLSEIAGLDINGEKIMLTKPMTFMNNSGITVSKLALAYRLRIAHDLIVVHDDITLDLGTVKISKNTGAGKHNGVQSIIDHINTKNFPRVRCGIGRGSGVLTDVVLSRFTRDERTIVGKMIKKAVGACISIVTDGVADAMNTYNR